MVLREICVIKDWEITYDLVMQPDGTPAAGMSTFNCCHINCSSLCSSPAVYLMAVVLC